MDFRQYVRDRLPHLTVAREPEIVDELAQHLSDLYHEARGAGATHEEALGRAASALTSDSRELARDIESASRALPGLIADRWRLASMEPSGSAGRFSMFSDLRRDVQ